LTPERATPIVRASLRLASFKSLGTTLIILLVLACPIAGGCVDWRAELAASVLAAAALYFAAGEGGRLSVLSGASIITTAVIALQLIPVPPSLIRVLSPSTADTLEVALKPLALYPAARPLSLDPAASAHALGLALACSCLVLAVPLLARSRRVGASIVSGIAIAGLLVAAIGLSHAVATAASGLEAKIPFINPNHLAGFLNLAAWPALGLGLQATGNRRAAWLVCFAISASGVFLSLSRGGIGAFFVGLLIFTVLQLVCDGHQKNRRSWGTFLGASAAILGALAIASFLGHVRLLHELETISFGHL